MNHADQLNRGKACGSLLVTFSAAGTQAVLQVVMLIVLARLLSPDDFGIVSAALVVVGFSAIFSRAGVGPALIQRRQLTAECIRTAFTLSVLFSLLLGGGVWLLAPAFARFFDMDPLVPVLRVMCLLFPLRGVSAVAEALLQRELRVRLVVFIETLAVAVGYGVVGLSLALAGFGVWALVAAHLARTALQTFVLLAAKRHSCVPLLDRRACRELLTFGGGLTGDRISSFLAGHGDNVIIGRFLGAGALGIYGRAYHLMAGPALLFGTAVDRVLFPLLARMQEHPDRLAAAYRRGVAAIALAMLPLSTAVCVLAPQLVVLLLGPQWTGAVVPLQILAVGTLFRTNCRLGDSLARATGAVYRSAWRKATYALLVMLGAWVGHFWGIAGAAAGVLAALAVNFLLTADLCLKLTGMRWRSFAAAHAAGLTVALLIGPPMWLVAVSLTAAGCSPAAVVAASLAPGAITFVLLAFLPRLLGPDGAWIVQRFTEHITARLARRVSAVTPEGAPDAA